MGSSNCKTEKKNLVEQEMALISLISVMLEWNDEKLT